MIFSLHRSDARKLVLPTEEYYVLTNGEPGLIPCRPSHPGDFFSPIIRIKRCNKNESYFYIIIFQMSYYPCTEKGNQIEELLITRFQKNFVNYVSKTEM